MDIQDFEELDEVIKKDLTVHYVTWYRDVYDAIFAHDPANPPTPPAPELVRKLSIHIFSLPGICCDQQTLLTVVRVRPPLRRRLRQ
jgi:hypothetical protein